MSLGAPIDLSRPPDMNDPKIMREIEFILNKRPEERTKQEVYMILPFIINMPLFSEMNVEDTFNVCRIGESNKLKVSMEDKKFLSRQMRFMYCKAGENIVNYNEFGSCFFILLKGKAAVIIPKLRRVVE